MQGTMEQAAEMLRGILSRMGIAAEVASREDAERVTLEVIGAESGLIIGKHGATLDSLQYLVNKMGTRGAEEASSKPVIVDAEGYRERRAESLVELAQRLGEKALKTQRPVAAAPMSPADRRVMHMALADHPNLSTRSEGEGAARRLLIIPVKGGGRDSGRAGSRPPSGADSDPAPAHEPPVDE